MASTRCSYLLDLVLFFFLTRLPVSLRSFGSLRLRRFIQVFTRFVFSLCSFQGAFEVLSFEIPQNDTVKTNSKVSISLPGFEHLAVFFAMLFRIGFFLSAFQLTDLGYGQDIILASSP